MPGSALTLVGLRVVQQAAALGSFSAAADSLGYTQSAISRQVAAMERATGLPLFDRAGRGVRPTEAGTALAEHATEVFAALAAAEAAVVRIRERLDGRLVIGSIPVAMSVLVPRAIARLSYLNPGLDISLHEGSTPLLVERMHHGLLDLAVIALGQELPEQNLEGLRSDVLLSGGLKVAVPAGHRLAKRRQVPVGELRDEPWIVGQPVDDDEPIFGAWPTLTDAKPAYSSREWPSRLGMVAAGLGIALLPNIAVPSIPAGVAVVAVDDPAQAQRSAVALTPEAPTAAARAMVAALRTEAARIALEGRRSA